MSEHFSAHTPYQPLLSTISTSVIQSDKSGECPAGISRVLCAANGSCTLVAGERKVHLIGARMVFLLGPISYRLCEPTKDFMLTRLDIAMKPGKCCGYGCDELQAAFPEVVRMMRTPTSCVAFYDNYSLVISSLQNLQTFSLYDSPERDSQLMLTLCFLLAAVATSSWDEDMDSRRYSKHVRAALRYIHENYMCSITTTDIAGAAGVHVGHLHRIFPAETGMRVGEYLTNLRIEKAKSLLIRTDISTAIIAQRIGVSTLQYFCRLFKQNVGTTPQAYRKSYAITCNYGDLRSTYYTLRGGGKS